MIIDLTYSKNYLIMLNQNYCSYSDLPSPMAYMIAPKTIKTPSIALSEFDKNRIIEMAWEDRTPFDAIKIQFGLNENEVRLLMRTELKFKRYTNWRQRVEQCNTKHVSKRNADITRFKCSRQRTISHNKISKR